MDTNILLENGTNELELLEFTLGNNHYGINVAKVREILNFQPVTPVPNSHASVEGIFMPRDEMISVINLKKCINLPEDNKDGGFFIITNFNKLNIAFHVDAVLGIHRISWADIILPEVTVSSSDQAVSTGVVKMNGKLIVILDFEKIITDICPETGLKMSDIDKLGKRDRFTEPVFIAEDSALLSSMICNCLKKAGYTNLTVFPNGKELWDRLVEMKGDKKLKDKLSLIITDIEMPVMDGHRLTKLVKTDPVLKNVPIVIFSSLINDDMRRKGEMIGADAQLSKPEIGMLVEAIDELLGIKSE